MRLRIRIRNRKHFIAGAFAWLLMTFMILFPKGGFKVGDIPVTWGYIILALGTLPLLLARLIAFPLKLNKLLLGAMVGTLPFQVIFIYAFLANGITAPGFFVSSVLVLLYLPVMFLMIFPAFSPLLDAAALSRHFRFCVLAAAIFGIFLFFYHPIVGSFIEIPYLTVNAGDYGDLELSKHIARGNFLKLISTYNNGNVYGVATLILLPIYNALEPKRWKRNVLILALILTLSRTVWAGLVLNEVISLFLVLRKSFARFPKIVPGPAVKATLTVGVTLALVFGGLLFNFDSSLSFLFDKGLGGRGEQLNIFSHPEWVPQMPVGGFIEVIYSSALETFGILGLAGIVLLFITPVLLYIFRPQRFQTPLQQAALKGLVLYIFLAASDGALNLIPVGVFYWFAYMLFLYGWPGESHQQQKNLISDSTGGGLGPAPQMTLHAPSAYSV